MASLTEIRDAIARQLNTIDGLHAHATVPSQLVLPAAVVEGPIEVDFLQAMGRGVDKWLIPVRVLVGLAGDHRVAQDRLDEYLDSLSERGVKTAIEAGESNLSGTVDSVQVNRAAGYGTYKVGSNDYLGVEFEIEVLA